MDETFLRQKKNTTMKLAIKTLFIYLKKRNRTWNHINEYVWDTNTARINKLILTR